MANKKISDLFNSLDDNGKSYLSDLMNYNYSSSRRLQKLLKARDKARKDHTLRLLPDKLSDNHDREMNVSIANSEDLVKNKKDIDRVNNVFESPDVAKALRHNGGEESKFFNKQHVRTPIWKQSESLAQPQATSSVASIQSLQADNQSNQSSAPSSSESPYFKEGSDEELNAVDNGEDMYKKLSPEGQHYFDMNLHYAKINPVKFKDAKNAKGKDFNKLSTYQQEARLYTNMAGEGRVIKHGRPMSQSGVAMPIYERNKVDKFFNDKGAMTAIKSKALLKGIKDLKKRQKLSEIRKLDNAKSPLIQHKDLDRGMFLYDQLPLGGKRLFMENARLADKFPDKFHDFKTKAFADVDDKLKPSFKRLNDVKAGVVYQDHAKSTNPDLKVSRDEQNAIQDYFSRDSIPGLAHRLSSGVNDYNKSHFPHGDPAEAVSKFHVNTDYKARDPERYDSMLNRGADIYDNLTPQGRKYMYTATQEASKDLDDFNKALYGNPNSLNKEQAGIRSKLVHQSGWDKAQDGKNVQLNPTENNENTKGKTSLDLSEKNKIDSYLHNNLTQEGLANHDTYSVIVMRNIKNRQLDETRADEDATLQSRYSKVKQSEGRTRRKHPIAYFIGAGLADGVSPFVFNKYTDKLGDKVHNSINSIKSLKDRIVNGKPKTPAQQLHEKRKKEQKATQNPHDKKGRSFRDNSKPKGDFFQKSRSRLRKRAVSHRTSHFHMPDHGIER